MKSNRADKVNSIATETIDQIEIILLVDRGAEFKIDGKSVRMEGEPNSFAVDADENCFMIGVISEQLQAKRDMHGGDNLQIQRGTHSAPCNLKDVTMLFGPDVSKLRIIETSVARFDSGDRFIIPRNGLMIPGNGFIVEAKVNGPDDVAVRGLHGEYDVGLLRLIAMEAVNGAIQPRRTIN